MGETGEVPIGINYITDTKPDENPYHFYQAFPQYHEILKNEINRNLDETSLREEINFIKDELHCDSLKVMGHSAPEAIKVAQACLKTGITPWLCPRFIGATFEQTKEMLQKYCEAAKQNSLEQIPLVLANELPNDCASDTITEQFTSSDYGKRGEYLVENYFKKGIEINSTQRIKDLIRVARNAGWKGILTYAALPEERVDWDQIDDPNVVVGVNLYWGKNHETGKLWTPEEYDSKLKEIIKGADKRPVIVTEFGSVPQKKGLDGGGAGWALDSPIDYEAQSDAYKAYLTILQANNVGYFAYAFHESKENPNRLHKSFGIALRNTNNQIDTLTPAGKLLAEYNLRAKGVKGITLSNQ